MKGMRAGEHVEPLCQESGLTDLTLAISSNSDTPISTRRGVMLATNKEGENPLTCF